MARRGVFGRLPRAAPDLTNSLVALVREANAQQDQNMVDAWKNGGKVDGKGVDDTRLLDYMADRSKELSPDDPTYDEWQNRHTQYTFAIEESKMALKNDQGKISDAEMGAFYKKWAGRTDVQKDSEFYRHLLSQGAKWDAAAKAGSAARGRDRTMEIHNAKQKHTYDTQVKPVVEKLTPALLQIAIAYNAAPVNADSLDDIRPDSVGYGKFMDIIEDGKVDDPNVQLIIDAATADLKASGLPGFVWSQSNLNALYAKADRGQKKLMDDSINDNERDGWRKSRDSTRYDGTRVKNAPSSNRVQIATDAFSDALDDCKNDPYCKRSAVQTYKDALKKEAGNLIAGGTGGVTLQTQDLKEAAALVNTMSQLDDIIAGRTTRRSVAGQIGMGEGEVNPKTLGYTIFDAAADQGGTGEPSGFLVGLGESINADAKKIDAGGWMQTVPMTTGPNGTPVLDGEGNPRFTYQIWGPEVPPPDGSIPVDATVTFTDPTRVGTIDPDVQRLGQKPGATTKTPTVYVFPSPPSIEYRDEAGQTVGADQAVQLGNDGALPWVELKGIPGADGKSRTIYRVGSGKPGDPFVYTQDAPVPANTPKGAGGRPIVTTTVGLGPNGEPTRVADPTLLIAGATAAKTKMPSGNLPLGSFSTTGATAAALAIRDAFAAGGVDAPTKADAYLTNYTNGIRNLPAGSPERLLAVGDLNQLNQQVNLFKTGKVGKPMDDAYKAVNSVDPTRQGYYDQLAQHGITAGLYGMDEVNRRANVLAGVDAAEKRVAANAPAYGAGGYGGYAGLGPGGALADMGRNPKNDAERMLLEQSKRDVFTPSISVSSIKVPGMPTQFQQSGGLASVAAPGFGLAPMPMGGLNLQTPFAPATPLPSAGLAAGQGGGLGPGTGGNLNPTSTFTPPKAPTPKAPEPPRENPMDTFAPPKPKPVVPKKYGTGKPDDFQSLYGRGQ